jgi:hypothetical protein
VKSNCFVNLNHISTCYNVVYSVTAIKASTVYNESITTTKIISTINFLTLYGKIKLAWNNRFSSGTFAITSNSQIPTTFFRNILCRLYLQFCLPNRLWLAVGKGTDYSPSGPCSLVEGRRKYAFQIAVLYDVCLNTELAVPSGAGA